MLLDLSDETDVNQDFENWEPDPIDADACKLLTVINSY